MNIKPPNKSVVLCSGYDSRPVWREQCRAFLCGLEHSKINKYDDMEITLKSIGFAKNQEKKHFGNWHDVVTDLVIADEYREGLQGLEDYSHLIVIYWMHDVKTCDIRHVPQGKVGEVPEVGIFACRCPQRPNPIGVSTVEKVGIKGNIVTVKGLDIINDTPILDLKPYTPQYDAAANVRVPNWVSKLDY